MYNKYKTRTFNRDHFYQRRIDTFRKMLKKSTTEWTTNYPKDKDLLWKVKGPNDVGYTITNKMPFDLSKDYVYNKKNVESFKRGSLSEFL